MVAPPLVLRNERRSSGFGIPSSSRLLRAPLSALSRGEFALYHFGVKQLREFADGRVKERLADRCMHCGNKFDERGGRTADHVPSKALLSKPYPANLPTVEVCGECNNGFSGDEQYVAALIACVLAGSTSPCSLDDPRIAAMLERNPRLRSRIERARREPLDPNDPPLWEAESDRVSRVLVKNARGHAWFECAEVRFGRPEIGFAAMQSLPDHQQKSFAASHQDFLLPEVGSRLFVRSFTGQDIRDGWVTVQEGKYRYSVEAQRGGGLRIRIVIAEYLVAEVTWTSA